jgi:hypothetical protein
MKLAVRPTNIPKMKRRHRSNWIPVAPVADGAGESSDGFFCPALSQIADSALVALRLEGKK